MPGLNLRLTDRQRKIADSIIISMCRKDYEEALHLLQKSSRSKHRIPPFQEAVLRRILQRLMQKPSRRERFRLMEHREIQHPDHGVRGLQDLLLARMEMPRETLDKIYERAFRLSFTNFYNNLLYVQRANKVINFNMHILANQCMRLIRADAKIARMEPGPWIDWEEVLIYSFVICISLLLVFVF